MEACDPATKVFGVVERLRHHCHYAGRVERANADP